MGANPHIPTGRKPGRPKSDREDIRREVLLRLLTIHDTGCTVPELASYVNLAASTVHGDMHALLAAGKVTKSKIENTPSTYLWRLSANETADRTPQQSAAVLTQQPRSHSPTGVGRAEHSLHYGK